jgi:hypothetical protein
MIARGTLFIRLVGIHRCRTIIFVSDGQEDRLIMQDCIVRTLRRTIKKGLRAVTKLPYPYRLLKMMQNRRENNKFCRMLTKTVVDFYLFQV